MLNRTQFAETLRRATNAINPFYHNPIMVMPCYQHLDGERRVFQNSHLVHADLVSILKSRIEVADALREVVGEFMLEASVIDGHLKANLHVIYDGMDEIVTHRVFSRTWATDGSYRFLVEVNEDGEGGKIRALLGEAYGCFYNPIGPHQSWTIKLTEAELKLLGL